MSEELKTLAEAESPEEFQALRKAHREAAQAPAPEKETPPVAEEQQVSEIAVASEAAESTTQEKPAEPKKERSAEARIAELRAKGRHAEANKIMVEAAVKAERDRISQLEKELQEARTRKPEPGEDAPKSAPPKVQAEATDDPEPSEADDKYKKADGTFDERKFSRDLGRWDAREELRADRRREAEGAVKDRIQKAVDAAKSNPEMVDFDQVMHGVAPTYGPDGQMVNAGSGLVLTPAMIQYLNRYPDDAVKVFYHLGKNPAEYQRIRDIYFPANSRTAPDPVLTAEVFSELKSIHKLLTTPTQQATPDKPKLAPAVTKASAPPKVLSGPGSVEPKNLSEIDDFDVWKRARSTRRG